MTFPAELQARLARVAQERGTNPQDPAREANREMRGIIRYDRARGTVQRHSIPPGDQNSEPMFVPRPGGSAEDDGWLLACVYRHATDTSDVLVPDARDLSAPPLAVVQLPRRIPAGFHGTWLPAPRE